jgi:hypothetical protein
MALDGKDFPGRGKGSFGDRLLTASFESILSFGVWLGGKCVHYRRGTQSANLGRNELAELKKKLYCLTIISVLLLSLCTFKYQSFIQSRAFHNIWKPMKKARLDSHTI